MTTLLSHNAPLDELAGRLTGRVVRPGDADYARLATPWNVAVPSAPAAVVQAAEASDVSAAVRFAARHGLSVDVRATGHGALAVDGSTLLVHTGLLDEVTIHADGWARVGAGVLWESVLQAAAPHGFAAPAGSAPRVGVVGFLTGGGLSPVGRSFGVASDYVRAFDVVTGDGQVRRVTPHEHPDLFWGLRGGKGALGIVTAVEFDLLPVTSMYGGCLYFDGADAAMVLHAWRGWTAGLDDRATTSVAIMRLPDMPMVPPPLAGRTTVAVRFAWTGDQRDGADAFAPMQDVATPLLGGVGAMAYTELGSIHSDPIDPMPTVERNVLLDSLPADAVDALLAVAGPDAPCPQIIVELRQLGGAIARPSLHPGAVDHRDAAFSLLTIGIGVPPVVGGTLESAGAIQAAVSAWSHGVSLPNFGSASVDHVRASYAPATLARLGELTRRYDPHALLACARPLRAATR